MRLPTPLVAGTAAYALTVALAVTLATPRPATPAPTTTSPASPRVIALVHATVIDGTGAAARPRTTVLVRDGHVAGVFADGTRPLPRDAMTLDLSGRWIIPGLIDGHVHLATVDRPASMVDALRRAALMGGVTTVRDMGGNSSRLADAARRQPRPDAPMARLYWAAVASGPRWFATYDSTRVRFWSDGATPGTAPGVRLVDARTDLRALARQAHDMGATALKLYDDVPPDRVRALVVAAHAEGLRVWAHALVKPSTAGDLSRAGVDLVTHADMLVWAAAARGDSLGDRATRARLMGTVSPSGPELRALFDTLRAHGTLFEPTLYVMARAALDAEPGDPHIEPLPAWAIAVTGAAARAGVPIVAGTDALGGSTPNLPSELELLVRHAGLTPMQAIQAATQHGARALGIDSLGTIAPGKVADLVVLTADPLADIRNTRAIDFVMQSGYVHRRAATVAR